MCISRRIIIEEAENNVERGESLIINLKIKYLSFILYHPRHLKQGAFVPRASVLRQRRKVKF
jgi:hypothetical protein